MADVTENQNETPLIDPTVLAGTAVADDTTVETKPLPVAKKADKGGFFWGTGRRKRSVARVRLKPGSGKMVVNKKDYDKYFTQAKDINAVTAPLKAVSGEKSFDVFVNVQGGGTTGQAGAMVLGLSRALLAADPDTFDALRNAGYLTRDPRMVERKKYGQRGARRRFQFSKR